MLVSPFYSNGAIRADNGAHSARNAFILFGNNSGLIAFVV
jgi:hypothetical protein